MSAASLLPQRHRVHRVTASAAISVSAEIPLLPDLRAANSVLRPQVSSVRLHFRHTIPQPTVNRIDRRPRTRKQRLRSGQFHEKYGSFASSGKDLPPNGQTPWNYSPVHRRSSTGYLIIADPFDRADILSICAFPGLEQAGTHSAPVRIETSVRRLAFLSENQGTPPYSGKARQTFPHSGRVVPRPQNRDESTSSSPFSAPKSGTDFRKRHFGSQSIGKTGRSLPQKFPGPEENLTRLFRIHEGVRLRRFPELPHGKTQCSLKKGSRRKRGVLQENKTAAFTNASMKFRSSSH